MKKLILILLILTCGNTYAQVAEKAFIDDNAHVNIPMNEVHHIFTAPEINNGNLKSGSIDCDITATYTNFTEEAKAAFEYAISIWEENISSPVQIHIHVSFDNLADNVLGQGKPALFLRNFKSTPQVNVFYPIALVEKITGKEYNEPIEADIICSFNLSKPWYFGTNGKTPENRYDFVGAVLHEIGHGLGISGFFKNENGIAQFSNNSNSPSIYDFFIFNTSNQRISDKNIFPSPSSELTKQLTSNGLVINYENEFNETTSANVYAPSSWTNGVSIYHLKRTDSSAGNDNEVMYSCTYKGEAIHNPGKHTLHILSEIGWGDKSAYRTENITAVNNNEILENTSLIVYPNPCSNYLNIDLSNSRTFTPVLIEIFNVTGKLVHKVLWNTSDFGTEKQIDLTSLKSGIYLVQATVNNSKKIANRIIKN
jgi:hypothetical protein